MKVSAISLNFICDTKKSYRFGAVSKMMTECFYFWINCPFNFTSENNDEQSQGLIKYFSFN